MTIVNKAKGGRLGALLRIDEELLASALTELCVKLYTEAERQISEGGESSIYDCQPFFPILLDLLLPEIDSREVLWLAQKEVAEHLIGRRR